MKFWQFNFYFSKFFESQSLYWSSERKFLGLNCVRIQRQMYNFCVSRHLYLLIIIHECFVLSNLKSRLQDCFVFYFFFFCFVFFWFFFFCLFFFRFFFFNFFFFEILNFLFFGFTWTFCQFNRLCFLAKFMLHLSIILKCN